MRGRLIINSFTISAFLCILTWMAPKPGYTQAAVVAPPSGPLGGPPPPSGVRSLSGAQVSPQQVDATMQSIGISPNEALLLKQQLAMGVMSPQEAQSLCAHLMSSHVSPAMIPNIVGNIGLNAAEFQQVQSCLSPNAAAGQMVQPPVGVPVAPPPP